MEIEQVAELARAVAGLPQAERDYFDGMVADERAAIADAERIAKLRKMSDLDAVQFAIKEASDVFALDGLPERLLQALREAGFVRTGGITLEQAYRAGFGASAEGWNHEIHGDEVFAKPVFKDEMAAVLGHLKPEAAL